MAPNERARKKHDELFPGHVSTVAVTDPELIEIYDNFAFDEVLRLTEAGHSNPTDDPTCIDHCLPRSARVSNHAGRGAQRWSHTRSGERDHVPGGALHRHGQSFSTSSRPPTTFSPSEASSFPCRASPPPRQRPARRRALLSRSRSSAPMRLINSMTHRLATSCIFNTFYRPIVLAITTRAPASTFRHASCSPSACLSRLAVAMLRSRAMSPQTSTSATTARG